MSNRFSAGVVRLCFAAVCSVLALSGCGGSGNTLQRVEITPNPAQAAKGTALAFTATAIFANGAKNNVTDEAVWSSSDLLVATISNAAGSRGIAQAVEVGTATIQASFQGVSGSAKLTVTPAVITGLQVTPTNPSIAKGTQQQFKATAIFSDNTTQDVTTAATWSSSNTSVATISNASGSQGLAQGAAQGSTTISAAYQDQTGSTTLTVTPTVITKLAVTPTDPSIAKGTIQQFKATAIFSDNTTQDVTTAATWSSSNTSVATISNASGSQGLAQGAAQGSTTISAAYQGQTGSTTLTVTAAVLTSIAVTPTDPSVPSGQAQQFTATGTYSDGSTQNLTTSVTWASSNTAVADISNAAGSQGLAATRSQGTTTISATSQNITGSTTLTVTPATLTAIQVTPSNASLAKGFNLQYTATGIYSDNSKRNITTAVTWVSTNTSVATISNASGSQGLASGVAAGSTTITATQGSIQGSTGLTVTNATLSSLSVTPSNATIPAGTTQQYTATGTFSDNTTQDLTTQVTWSTSDTTIATISNAGGSQGLAKGVKAGGPVTITATRGSVSGTASLTVSNAVLTSIGVTSPDNQIPKGTTEQYTATGTYSDGSKQDITTQVTWSSSDTTVATISNASGSQGLAKGVSQGSTTISASLNSVTGSKPLTVTAAVLTSIAVSPQNPSVPLGVKPQFMATGTYSDGSKQDITTQVTWTSSDTSVATISNAAGSQGQATTLKQGSTTIAAASGSISGTSTLTVTPVALTSIAITPANPSLAAGTTLQLKATGTYSDGSTQDLTTQVTWASSNTSIADVSNASGSQGLLIGRSQGQATITATAPNSGVQGSTPATVTPAQLRSIIVTPANPKLAAGFKLNFTATGQYSDGSTQDLTTQATWTVLDTNTATISNAQNTEGEATGVALGGTSVVATLNGVSGSTSLTVTNATLSSIAVTPANATIKAGTTLQYTAKATFSDGGQLDQTKQVTWASSNTNVATISNAPGSQGLATAKNPPIGTSTTISATEAGVTGSTTLNVTLN